jgi:hypothetical protein
MKTNYQEEKLSQLFLKMISISSYSIVEYLYPIKNEYNLRIYSPTEVIENEE